MANGLVQWSIPELTCRVHICPTLNQGFDLLHNAANARDMQRSLMEETHLIHIVKSHTDERREQFVTVAL